MKISKTRLEQIIREELARYIQESLNEEPKSKSVADASDDRKSKGKKDPEDDGSMPDVKPQTGNDPPKQASADQPVGDDPADDELEDDEAEKDAADVADDAADDNEEPGSGIADEVVGKTIQSITMEPKSKILPGAIELNITFDQIAEPLKVLITKTGAVKFFFKGLHNEL